MSRYLCDTSVLVATLCSWHEHHERTTAELRRREQAGEEIVLAAHSLAETYSVLTRLPAPNRLRAADAISLIEANWRQARVEHLTAEETWETLRSAQRLGVTGGQTYDLLIAACGVKVGAAAIVTWNVRRFSPVASEVAVEAPA